jgi:DNA modification methylase
VPQVWVVDGMSVKSVLESEVGEAAPAAVVEVAGRSYEQTVIDVGDLRGYERNSRTHSPEQVAQICASIERFGWTNPLLVDEDGMIIAGHGRMMAADKLGLKRVPCVVLSGLSEDEKRALVIADNQLALNAGWDLDLLTEEVRALSESGFDTDVLGFDGDVLADFLAETNSGLEDPDHVPDVGGDVVTVPGDVWILGRHRIVCGDSTDPLVVDKCLDGEVPRLMVTDPPYGVEYDASWRAEALGKDDCGDLAVGKVLNDDRADWREVWALFPGSVCYVWHGALHAAEVAASLEDSGFPIRSQIVWVKTRAALSRGNYHWQHEPAFYAAKDGDDGWQHFEPDHDLAAYAVKKGDTAKWRGGRKQTSVWFIEHLKSETGHSTQKPVECMKRPMENNSAPGEWVFEPFSGSGSSIIAAEMCGRRCCAIELNAEYVDVAVRRWENFVGGEAVLEGDGRTFAQIKEDRV